MKIGLIYPSQSRKATYSSSDEELRDFFSANKYVPSFYLPSLSLLTIAACTPRDIEVKILDERVHDVNFEEHFDLVGITIITEQAHRGYQIAQQFKKRGVFTVMGGIHASVLPEETEQFCDCVIVGEAETIWPQFLKDLKKGSVKSRYTNKVQVNLEKSPVPRYDLLNIDAYPFIPSQTSRGCPHDCSFCTVTKVFGPKFRNKTVKQVLREVEAIQIVSRTRRIAFNDDNMFVNRQKSYELPEALVPYKIRYFTQSDVSLAEDERLLTLMQKSGCVTVFIGFESLIPENLQSFQHNKWKHRRLKTYSTACKKIQSFGIQVLGAFILGSDHDSKDVFEGLVEFTLENNILGQYHFLTPFPGTKIREQLIAEKRLNENATNWGQYSCFDVVFTPKNMTEQELKKGLLHIYKIVYTESTHLKRMRHMIEMLKKVKYNGDH